MHLLVDLGGTNTRVGLADETGLLTDTIRRFSNVTFSGLAPLLSAYLDEVQPGAILGLCAGVAGPVQGKTAQLTNFDWLIDASDLGTATGAQHVHLINDLQAQGYALDDLPTAAVTPIFGGATPPSGATRLVLNLGTGCNVAVVHCVGSDLFVPAAESGHSALPHRDGELDALFHHLKKAHPHLPIEAALSGPGLSNIHAWSAKENLTPKEIINQATSGHSKAHKTLSFFVQILGTVAGNFALHHLPMGGLYFSGGLASAIAPFLNEMDFLDPFTARGPYTDIVQAIPVFVITKDGFALHGCNRYLRQILN